MFGFINKAFFTGLKIFSSVNLLGAAPLNAISLSEGPLAVTPLRYISINNLEDKDYNVKN